MAQQVTNKYSQKQAHVLEGTLASEGYQVYDYVLALQPHEDLCTTILEARRRFATAYACAEPATLTPRVTLVRFKQHALMEPHITRRLRGITAAIDTFRVELNNFGSLPSHTIYFAVTSKVQIMNAVKALRAAQKLMKLDDDNKPHFLTAPYITLAQQLLPWQFEKGWAEYQQQTFHARFMADQVVLLKRPSGGRYTLVERFPFRGLHTAVTQGALFDDAAMHGIKDKQEEAQHG